MHEICNFDDPMFHLRRSIKQIFWLFLGHVNTELRDLFFQKVCFKSLIENATFPLHKLSIDLKMNYEWKDGPKEERSSSGYLNNQRPCPPVVKRTSLGLWVLFDLSVAMTNEIDAVAQHWMREDSYSTD